MSTELLWKVLQGKWVEAEEIEDVWRQYVLPVATV